MTMQVKEAPASRKRAGNGRDAAKAVFAVGGLLAAFGVASCCALPVALSLLGISAASLVGIGYLAAQYQRELFYVSAACLGVAALLSFASEEARPVRLVERAPGPCRTGAACLPFFWRLLCLR